MVIAMWMHLLPLVRLRCGLFLGLPTLAHPVRQLQDLERSLRRREAEYRGIVEDQTELICWITPQGIINYINGAVTRYLADPSGINSR